MRNALLWTACLLGDHHRCHLGRGRNANHCPYWKGWRGGFADAEKRARRGDL